MSPSVKSVRAVDNYQLMVEFDNNEQGVLNMAPYLDFDVFSKLKDRSLFNTVKVCFDTIEWDTGIDLDPKFVYEKCDKQAASAY